MKGRDKKSRRRRFGGSRPGGEGHEEYDERIGAGGNNKSLGAIWHGEAKVNRFRRDQPLKIDQLTTVGRDYLESLKRSSHDGGIKNARCDWCNKEYEHKVGDFKISDVCSSCREAPSLPRSAKNTPGEDKFEQACHEADYHHMIDLFRDLKIAKGKKVYSKKKKKKKKKQTKKPKKR